MQELRFVAVSEDGSYAVLAVPGRSGRYILPIDERLRAVAQGQTSRLAQYEIEVESPLRPKEIQSRIRAGETAEEIADAAGIPVERVRWFEGPVLAERAYISDQAQTGSVRRAGDSSGPGPRLGDIVTARLSAAGTDPADGQWDSRKRGDGNWQVSLTFPSGGRLHVAEWVFDPRRRHVMPDDDNAARLSLPESELPAEPVPMPGEATVTQIATRLGAAAGMGGGPGVSRFRPDRSVIPDRSLGADRSLADRPAPPAAPAPERTAMADRPAMSDRSAVSDRFAAPERASAPQPPAPPRPAQQDRPGYQGRTANPGYAEFPESAPYRAPEASPEPTAERGYGDTAPGSPAYRAPVTEAPAPRTTAPEPRGYPDPDPAPEEPVYRPLVTERPAYRDEAPEPAAHGTPVADEDTERMWLAPPRPVIFEDSEPAFPDDLDPVPAQPAPEPLAASPVAAPPVAAPPVREVEPPAAEQARPAGATPAAAVSTGGATVAEPAAVTQPGTRQQEPVAAQAAPVSATRPEPVVAARTAEPDQVTAAAAESPREDTTGPAPVPGDTVTAVEPEAQAEQVTAASALPAVAEPAPATPEPAVPAAPEPKADVPAPAEPAAAEDQSARARGGAKKTAKGRRSSVPSWDEIMLGSSRQRE